jgi:hypothetical protein
MKPSRELDEIIFTSVMGLTMSHVLEIPNYSTNITAAWEVIDQLQKTNFLVQTRTFSNQPHPFINQPHQSQCLILKEAGVDNWIVGYGDTMPHAICMAALESIENQG